MRESSQGEEIYEIAASLLQQARLAVLFSGAGFSTPSGIPDFRSPSTGLWTQNNPMECASLTTFIQSPEKFFAWLHPLAKQMYYAKPNRGHMATAELEQKGYLKAIITQNIDRLHQAAGSQNVFELHGSIDSASCFQCGKRFPADVYLPKFIESAEIPRCPTCSGILKPNITLFEEMLPMEAWQNADELSKECDLMIVAGSSLEVVPAAAIPQQAARNGAKTIIINYSPTHLDQDADCLFRDDIQNVLAKINRMLA